MLNSVAQLQDKARFQLALGSTTVGHLGERRTVFFALNSRLRFDHSGEVRLTIGEPHPNCKFLGFLQQLKGRFRSMPTSARAPARYTP